LSVGTDPSSRRLADKLRPIIDALSADDEDAWDNDVATLKDIAKDLDDIASDPGVCDYSDFDELLSQLYAWGDVDNSLWIETH
jgi:hypothetical protein